MKTIIIFCLVISSVACAHIPSLGPGEITKVWHVHPDDRARFDGDRRRCFEVAALAHGDERLADSCLQREGYRLEIKND